MFDIIDKIELESYFSEFETAITLFEYYVKAETMQSYFMEGNVNTSVQPNITTTNRPQSQQLPNQSQPVNGQPLPNQSQQLPNQSQPVNGQPLPNQSQPVNGQPPTAAQILAKNGANAQKKRNILQRMFDVISKIWSKITNFFTDKDSEQKVESAINTVEKARNDGMSKEEFINDIIKTYQDQHGGSSITDTNNSEISADSLKEFYSTWFESGNIPTHLSEESVKAMNEMIRVTDQVAKTLPRYSVQQLEVEGPKIVRMMNTEAEKCSNALNKNALIKVPIWKKYFFMAGDMSRKIQKAFDELKKTLDSLYNDPEKGPVVDKVFGNISGPFKNIITAAKVLNHELEMVTLSNADKKLADFKGAQGQRLFGSKHHMTSVSTGKSNAVKKGTQSYEEKLRASGDYTEKEIKHLSKIAKKEFSKGYNDEFNRAADESTERHDLRNLAKKKTR